MIRENSNEHTQPQAAEPLYLYKVGKTIMSKPTNKLYHLVKVIQSPVPYLCTKTETNHNYQFSISNYQFFGVVHAY